MICETTNLCWSPLKVETIDGARGTEHLSFGRKMFKTVFCEDLSKFENQTKADLLKN